MPSHKHEEVNLAILQHTGNQDSSLQFSLWNFAFFYHNSLTFIFIFSNYFTKYSYSSFWALGHSPHCYTQSKHLVYLTFFWHGTHLLSENLCQGSDKWQFLHYCSWFSHKQGQCSHLNLVESHVLLGRVVATVTWNLRQTFECVFRVCWISRILDWRTRVLHSLRNPCSLRTEVECGSISESVLHTSTSALLPGEIKGSI